MGIHTPVVVTGSIPCRRMHKSNAYRAEDRKSLTVRWPIAYCAEGFVAVSEHYFQNNALSIIPLPELS